jgi:plastocyanin
VKRLVLPILLAIVVAAAVALATGRLPVPSGAPPRTVVLSMRNYAFNDSNPTLTFESGERVRFVVRNDEDSPVRHNFRIEGLAAPGEKDLLPGETREVIVTLPRSGEFAYSCATHSGMGGRLVVRRR